MSRRTGFRFSCFFVSMEKGYAPRETAGEFRGSGRSPCRGAHGTSRTDRLPAGAPPGRAAGRKAGGSAGRRTLPRTVPGKPPGRQRCSAGPSPVPVGPVHSVGRRYRVHRSIIARIAIFDKQIFEKSGKNFCGTSGRPEGDGTDAGDFGFFCFRIVKSAGKSEGSC